MTPMLRYTNHLFLAALGLGVCADQLFYGRWLGVSVVLFTALCLATLLGFSIAEGRPPERSNLWMGAAALFFAFCAMWRATPLLAVFNILTTMGLALLLVAGYRKTGLQRWPGWQYPFNSLLALIELGLRPAPALVTSVSHMPIRGEQTRQLAPVGRGLVLALPIVGGFTGLLMAADSVFASYVFQIASLQLPFDLATVLPHMMLMLGVAWVCVGGVMVAMHNQFQPQIYESPPNELPAVGETQRLTQPQAKVQFVGSVEALTVLIAVNALFASFIAIQGAYFFGGVDTLARTGMTFSQYARRGFFELLAVAILALGLLWLLALLTHREKSWQRHAFNSASAVLIVLVLGLLASAFFRMRLYEQAYGYTHLRLYTYSFMIWLGLVLLLFLTALLREQPHVFTFGSFVTALAALALLNIANPDQMIVRENIARYQASADLDADYLATLSTDATPALVARLPLLDPTARNTIEQALRWQQEDLQVIATKSGWPGWHLSRAQAQAALANLR